MHLDISALHFPGNRWKQCIKAPRGNPGHPGIAEAWLGSGEQVGICSVPLIACRTRHPCGELGFLCLYCMCVSVWRDVFISVFSVGVPACHLSAAFSQGYGGFTFRLQASFTGRGLVSAVHKLSHWLPLRASFTLTYVRHLAGSRRCR